MVLGLLDQLQIFWQFYDRIAWAFKRSGDTQAVAFDISKAWHAGFLHKPEPYGISVQIFDLISSFLSNRRLCVVLNEKFSQEYPVNAGVPQDSILGPTLFLLYINKLPNDVACNIVIYANDTTLYSKSHQASDLWWQLELASELESNLRETVDWGRKWLVDFNAGKTQLASFGQSNNTGAMDVFLRKDYLLRCWGWLSQTAKPASKKIGALIHSMKYFSWGCSV